MTMPAMAPPLRLEVLLMFVESVPESILLVEFAAAKVDTEVWQLTKPLMTLSVWRSLKMSHIVLLELVVATSTFP